MRRMADDEIQRLLDEVTWGTLCSVTPEGEPYAIEFTYFEDGGDFCGIINPSGIIAACIRHQTSVCLKVCESSRLSTGYRGASLFGAAALVETKEPEEMARIWQVLETRMKKPGIFAIAAEKYSQPGNLLPILRIQVERRSGVTSWPEREAERK